MATDCQMFGKKDKKKSILTQNFYEVRYSLCSILHSGLNIPSYEKRLIAFSSYQPLDDIGRFVLCRGHPARDWLWAYGPVIDTHVVDQAGPVGAGFPVHAGAK